MILYNQQKISFLYPIIVLCVCLYVLYILYFHIRSPFWSKQPVFHFHHIKQWILPSGIIYNNGDFPKNKYYQPYEVCVRPFQECSPYIKVLFYQLIQNHYNTTKYSYYFPTNERIHAYFIGHNEPCFLSYIAKPRLLYNTTNGEGENEKEDADRTHIQRRDAKFYTTYSRDIQMICCLSSRPVDVYFCNSKNAGDSKYVENTRAQGQGQGQGHTPTHLQMNYVDFLCTHKNERKQNYAPKTIYTYAIESQKYTPNTRVFLFKREGELTSIIPAVSYTTYMYELKYWKSQVCQTPYNIQDIHMDGFNFIRKYIDVRFLCRYFKFIGYTNISNIYELIKVGCLRVFCLTIPNTEHVFALYFFKENDCGFQETDKNGVKITQKSIDCIGSVCFYENFSELLKKEEKISIFIQGFHHCVCELQREKYEFLIIENISHNNIFLKNIFLQKQYTMKSPTAYFFYNFAIHPYMENETFILL